MSIPDRHVRFSSECTFVEMWGKYTSEPNIDKVHVFVKVRSMPKFEHMASIYRFTCLSIFSENKNISWDMKGLHMQRE